MATTKKPTKKTIKPKTVTVRVCVGVSEKGGLFVPMHESPLSKQDIKYLEEEIKDNGAMPVWIEATLTVPEPPTVQGKETTAPKPKKRKTLRLMPCGGWD